MMEVIERACGTPVSRGTYSQLETYASLLAAENKRQNLIAQSTVSSIWDRHILDSAQLLPFAPTGARWIDIGSGAGVPGIVLAILSGKPVCLVEPRRLRAEFLARCVDTLKLDHVEVRCSKAERVTGEYDAITARAVASLSDLFTMTLHLSHAGTRWILPKGRSGAKELAEATRTWQGRFRTEPSMTDGDAVILVAEGVRPRGGTSR